MTNDEYTLTTIDNPYNPYDDFDGWNEFDIRHGYRTLQFLDRIRTMNGVNSDDFGPNIEKNDILRTIDEIVELNVRGVDRKIHPGEQPTPVKLTYSY